MLQRLNKIFYISFDFPLMYSINLLQQKYDNKKFLIIYLW